MTVFSVLYLDHVSTYSVLLFVMVFVYRARNIYISRNSNSKQNKAKQTKHYLLGQIIYCTFHIYFVLSYLTSLMKLNINISVVAMVADH